MHIQTFRAKTMQQALDHVWRELGPEATVLHTRELNTGLVSRFLRGREYEIAATCHVAAPTRLAETAVEVEAGGVEAFFSFAAPAEEPAGDVAADDGLDTESGADLFGVYAELIEADLDESLAAEMVERLREQPGLDPGDRRAVNKRLAEMLAAELPTSGPIVPGGEGCRVVALVGPTGVGKTTTIAKLAANFRLRENLRVGLVTVDTYRIAAVEQLRTYAEIIELPMEVVSTPREVRQAIAQMEDLDLVLMDTAGRSPKDEVRIQELKSLLAEARPDEVHLVLSATGSVRSLATTAERFAPVGTSSMVVTKLDEATGLGQIVGLTRASGLPISYLTDGQNVPDDIEVADSRGLAKRILEAA